MIHFNLNNLKSKLCPFLILIFMIMAFPAMTQAKKPINNQIQPKPKLSAPAPAAAPRSAPAVAPVAVNLKFTAFLTNGSPIAPGSLRSVSATVKNFGIRSSGRYMVKFYLAKDSAGNRDSRLIASVPARLLASNATKTFDRSLRIPEGLTPGFYYLVARVEQAGTNPVQDTRSKRLAIVSSTARLAVTILSVAPERPMKGESVHLSVKVKNRGITSANNVFFSYGFYRSCSSSHIGSFFVKQIPGSISMGNSKTVDVRIILPLNAPSGNLKVKVIAGISGQTARVSDCEGIMAMEATLPDLTIALFETSLARPVTVKPGATIPVRWRVRNIGTSIAGSTQLYFYMGGSPTTASRSMMPRVVGVSGIGPGSSMPSYPETRITELKIPEDAQPGRTYIVGRVRVRGESGERTELNGSNNQKGFYINIAERDKPDLVISSLSLEDATIYAGDQLVFHVTIKNVSTVPIANQQFIGALHSFSTDNILDNSDRSLGGQGTWNGISPGSSINHTAHFRVPGDLRLGTYYIIAKADGSNVLDEVNENNNIRSVSFRVIPRPAIRVE